MKWWIVFVIISISFLIILANSSCICIMKSCKSRSYSIIDSQGTKEKKYICSKCNYQQKEQGKCPVCKEELKEHIQPTKNHKLVEVGKCSKCHGE